MIRVRRLAPALLVVSFSLAFFAMARADDEKKLPEGYKCDLRKLIDDEVGVDAKTGDAFLEEKDETQVRIIKDADDAGTELSSQEEESELHLECVKVLVASDAKEDTEETHHHYRAWRQKKKGAEDDTSLEGKVVVARRAGERRTFLVVTPDGARARVSADALTWVRKEHGTSKVSKKDKKKLDRLVPEEPVAPDGEWDADPKILSDTFFESAPIDPERSRAKGKFTKVRVEDGAICGTISFDIKIQLTKVPETTLGWDEGGLIEMKLERDAPLETTKKLRADERLDMRMQGKIRVENDTGARVREIEVRGKTRSKKRSVEAPAIVKLRFDPESEWRWNVAEWAAGDEPGASPEVGDRTFFELETTSTTVVKVNGRKTSDKKSALSSRVEVEVTAVAERKDTERKATIVKWSLTSDDETDDCLEGKTVLLVRAPKAGQPAYKVVDAKGRKAKLTDAAKSFVETELVKPRTRGMQLDNLHELLGPEPVAPDKEIGIDPETALKKIFGDGQEIDAETSKASATLKGVKVVAGDHEGKLEARVLLRLTSVPGAPNGRFDDEPATCDITFGFEGSLDRGKTGLGTATFKMDYRGKGTINGAVFEPKVITTRSIRSGVLPRPKKDDGDGWK